MFKFLFVLVFCGVVRNSCQMEVRSEIPLEGQEYIVAVIYGGDIMCQGAIINSTYIITVGYPMWGEPENYTVVYGTTNLHDEASHHTVKVLNIYENSNAYGPENDVVLLEVEPIDPKWGKPIALSTSPMKHEWKTRVNLVSYADTSLQYLKVPVFNFYKCKDIYQDFMIMPPKTLFCMGYSPYLPAATACMSKR